MRGEASLNAQSGADFALVDVVRQTVRHEVVREVLDVVLLIMCQPEHAPELIDHAKAHAQEYYSQRSTLPQLLYRT